jgi:hypothetical protein
MNNNKSIWPILFIVLFAGVFIQTLLGCHESPSGNSSTPRSEPNSFEYRYAKERLKQEGYSDKNSATAAEAILKFHNAQKNRR